MRPRVSLALASAAAATVVLAGCGSEGHVGGDAGDLTRGRELFINGQGGKQSCGSCHALADAGTKGTIGPDLDAAFADLRNRQGFDESTIRDLVRGQISYPVETPPTKENGRPAPGMPADLVTGTDADAVAAYVAAVAGLPVEGGQEGGEEAAASAKQVFTGNCGGCHTLADAGTSATVGPNLDETQMTRQEAIVQIRDGGGGMPPFKDQLTDEQISSLAEYILKSRKK